jgi:hypothetical protein
VTERDEQAQFRKMTRLELPAGIEPRDFYNFARQVVSEAKGLALSDWVGGGRPFSRAKYEALLDELAAAGLVALVNPDAPAQGRKLTRKGRQALMTYCELFETGQI